jgi:hypothetical protein
MGNNIREKGKGKREKIQAGFAMPLLPFTYRTSLSPSGKALL